MYSSEDLERFFSLSPHNMKLATRQSLKNLGLSFLKALQPVPSKRGCALI